jgi:hypothetical protein
MDKFILVASDTESVGGSFVPALTVLQHRLELRLWPIYGGTRNRRAFQVGSRVLFYVAGRAQQCQHIVASATILKIEPWSHRLGLVDSEDVLTDNPHVALRIDKPEMFPAPVSVREVLPHLEMRPSNMAKWGVLFHGGARKVSDKDFAFIEKRGKKR